MRRPQGGLDAAAGNGTIERREDRHARQRSVPQTNRLICSAGGYGPAYAGRASPRLSLALTPGQRRRRRRLDAGLLLVRRALQRQRGGGLVFTEPKTQRSKRTIPHPAPLAEALTEHRDQQAKERITAGQLWRGSPCVFTSPIGTPIDPRVPQGARPRRSPAGPAA